MTESAVETSVPGDAATEAEPLVAAAAAVAGALPLPETLEPGRPLRGEELLITEAPKRVIVATVTGPVEGELLLILGTAVDSRVTSGPMASMDPVALLSPAMQAGADAMGCELLGVVAAFETPEWRAHDVAVPLTFSGVPVAEVRLQTAAVEPPAPAPEPVPAVADPAPAAQPAATAAPAAAPQGAAAPTVGVPQPGVPQPGVPAQGAPVMDAAMAAALAAQVAAAQAAAAQAAGPQPVAYQMPDLTPRTVEPVGPAIFRPMATRLDQLTHVSMEVTVEIGRTRMSVGELLNLMPGHVIELDRAAGMPADLYVNGTLLAKGEIVVVDEDYGLRVTEIVSHPEQ